MLGFLVGELDLDQDVFVADNARCQLRRIDGVDVAEKLGGLARLVRLEMADQVKACALEMRDSRKLAFEFLDVVLAEIPQAEGMGLKDDLYRENLGDGQEQDAVALTTGLLAGEKQPLFDVG